MSTTQNYRSGTRTLARLATVIVFALAAGMGYAISPHVQSTMDLSMPVEDQGVAEPEFLPSECVIGGLVFSECNLDF